MIELLRSLTDNLDIWVIRRAFNGAFRDDSNPYNGRRF